MNAIESLRKYMSYHLMTLDKASKLLFALTQVNNNDIFSTTQAETSKDEI